MRSHYGVWDKSFEEELNIILVLCTIAPLNCCSSNVGCIADKVVEKAEENGIILMHDYCDTLVMVTLKVVDKPLEEEYTFVTMEEILFE